MTAMYATLLLVHSVLRWVVLLLAVLALFRAFGGWSSGRPWTPTDEKVGKQFILFFDLQVLIGLLLYVAFSPLTRAAFQNFGGVMGDSVMRFWAVEHIFGMLVAVALAHVGRVKARRLTDPRSHHRTIAIFFGLALLVMLLTIPWPFMPAARPMFPTLF
jgi:hypothetical protein